MGQKHVTKSKHQNYLFVSSVTNTHDLPLVRILTLNITLDIEAHFCIVTIHTHTHPFNGPLFGTTRVSLYQKGKTILDFTEARDSEWQWNLLGHTQVCTSLQTVNHASTPPLSFLQAGCPSCRPINSVKALKAIYSYHTILYKGYGSV